MRGRKKWVICVAILSFSIFTGCKTSSSQLAKESKNYIEELAKKARNQGTSEAYIEMKYAMGNDILEDDYNKYVQVRSRYEDEPTIKNLENLINATDVIFNKIYE